MYSTQILDEHFCTLSQEDLPPRITVHTARGHSSVGPAGEIITYPDSILDLDCTFNRYENEYNRSKVRKKQVKGSFFYRIVLSKVRTHILNLF